MCADPRICKRDPGTGLEVCFEQVAESASVAVAVIDGRDATVSWSNARFAELAAAVSGEPEVLGKTLPEVLAPAAQPLHDAAIAAPNVQAPQRAITWLAGEGDQAVAWRWTMTALPVAGRTDVILVAEDVTSQITALLEAELTADRFRMVAEGARDIILLMKVDGTIVEANPAASSLYGYRHDQLVLMSIRDLRAREADEETSRQIMAAADEGTLFETVHVRSDGTTFPVEVSSRRLHVGAESMILSIIRDISIRREREAEREQLLEELGVANARMDGLLRIVTAAVGSLDSTELLSSVLPAVSDVMHADAALLFVLEADKLVLRGRAGYDSFHLGTFAMPADRGIAGEIVRRAEPLSVSEMRSSPFALPIHEETGTRSALGVPIVIEGEVWAVLEAVWTEPRDVSDADVAMLTIAADKIGVAMASAERYELVQRTEKLSDLLNRLSVLVNSSLDLEATMEQALELACVGLRCDVAMLGTFVEGEWKVEFGYGVDRGFHELTFDHLWDRMPSGRTQPVVIDAESDAGRWLAATFGVRVGIAVPLKAGGEYVAALVFGRTSPEDPFDDTDVDFVDRLGMVVAAAIGNVQAYQAEHRVAETLQEALLEMPASVPGLAISHLYQSATLAARVGGDFFDAFVAPDGRVGIVIGDVSGKGLEAAVATSLIKHTMRAFAHEGEHPSEVMHRTNSVACATMRPSDFASALLVLLDPSTGHAEYCCAGHPRPLIVGANGAVRVLDCGSPIIGAVEQLDFEDACFVLDRDSFLLLYTDGVTEARGPAGFFGEERLVEAARALSDAAIAEVPQLLIDRVQRFTEGALTDDVAVLTLRLA